MDNLALPGKGLISSAISVYNHIDIAVSRLSPNAGHTFYFQGKKYVTHLIPVSGIINDRSTIFICAGSVIDVDLLFNEIKEFDIDEERIVIHPRAAIVTKEMISQEQSLSKISSTQSGTGAARASKIMRKNPLAQGTKCLQKFIKSFDLELYLNYGLNVFIETGQGLDLSLNHGLSYPFCTSTDITPSAILSDLGLHPRYLGNIMMSIRTFPIRVGNTKDSEGNEIGYSGPTYEDSEELTWEKIGQKEELTTVTGRVRRVFSFSKKQYENALKLIKPTHVFLNFINYLREEDLEIFLFENLRKPDYVGWGPHWEEVAEYSQEILEQMVIKWNE